MSNVLDSHIWPSFDFAEDEVRPVVFQVSAFGEPNSVVLRVVFETVFFERDCGTRVVVAVLSVLRWVCAVVPVSALGIPTVERFSESSKNSLTRLSIEVGVAFVVLQV